MKKNYLKDWTPADHARANKAIRKYLLSRCFDSNNDTNVFRYIRTFKQIDKIVGFAYTSSGFCAGLFICNIRLFIDVAQTLHIYGFILSDSNVFALCYDNEEEEIIFPID